jgi:glycosyltransferase involved in cell wall biosynthesis
VRILIINFAIGIPGAGPAYRTHHLAEFWAEQGHEVTVVATRYSHLLAAPTPAYGPDRPHRHRGVDYVVLDAPEYRGSGIGRMRNIASCLWQLRRMERVLADRFRPEAVIAATVYQLDNFSAWRIARRAGATFVRETRDLWPLTLMELGGMPAWHPFVLLVGAAERLAYRHADAVTTTLSNSREYMVSRGLPFDRWHYLPQCPPPERALTRTVPMPETHRQALEALRAAGKSIVLFAGSLVPANQIGLLVDTARELRGSRCQLVLVGRGPEESRVRAALAREPELPLTLLPAVEQSAVPALIAAADLALAALGPHPIYRHGISLNKVMEYLACGCPVILSADAPDNIVERSGAGVCVPPGDARRLAAAVRESVALPRESTAAMAAAGRTFISRHHGFPTMADNYLGQLCGVAAR